MLAEQNNALQEVAERSRLGVPLTISTDPRHHFQYTLGASVAAGAFSQRPETLGFAALRDPALVRRFGDVARREYRAVGIHEALSPQADLATEPRWPRTGGTFGEDPDLARDMVRAYVEGFQGGATGLERDGVICVVKHWVGYGAAVGGYDGHNYYGRFGRLDGALDLHIRAFEGAFAAKVAGVMPTYTIVQDVRIDGAPLEPVGGGFNRQLLTDVLRGRHGFDGVILSDWGITNDCSENCRTGATPHTVRDIAMPWGVESLSVVGALREGRARRARPVRRDAGLREARRGGHERRRPGVPHRPVGPSHPHAEVPARPVREPVRGPGRGRRRGRLRRVPRGGRRGAAARARDPGERARRDSSSRAARGCSCTASTPRRPGSAAWCPWSGWTMRRLRCCGLRQPSELEHPNHFFGRRQHEGRLDFRDGDADYEQIKSAAARVPTMVFVYLDRPAILTNVRDKAAALIGTFGATDAALLDVATGRAKAEGHLPVRAAAEHVGGRRAVARTSARPVEPAVSVRRAEVAGGSRPPWSPCTMTPSQGFAKPLPRVPRGGVRSRVPRPRAPTAWRVPRVHLGSEMKRIAHPPPGRRTRPGEPAWNG